MTDKMKDTIRGSMLDDFLIDGDKSKKPEPKRDTSHYGGRSQGAFNWNDGDDIPNSFRDDDGPDPMDDGYRGYSRPAPRTYTGADSVFNRRTSHENVVASQAHDDYARQVANLLRTVHQEQHGYVLESSERDELVGILMKLIGVQLDKVGIVWGTQGLKAFKETLKDLIPLAYYGTTRFTMSDYDDGEDFEDGRFGKTPNGTVYDRETGEVIGEEEDLEERLAIMEENAGHE